MVSFPNCKINIGLQVLQKRPDGFHDLETIFYPVPLHDIIEAIPSQNNNPFSFTSSGLAIDAPQDGNLCVKAYALLKQNFPSLPNVSMHLHKTIPMGAGLGGGSADGAFMLQLLNSKFQLGASAELLNRLSLQLGSDCPFFLFNKPSYATGRGEILEPVNISLKGYHLLLIHPGIHINTGWAFSQLKPLPGRVPLKSLLQLPVDSWKEKMENDFEHPVFQLHPRLKEIKNHLYEKGALYASMSGSGSSLYGIFKNAVQPAEFIREPGDLVFLKQLN